MNEKRLFELTECELQSLRVLLGTSPTKWHAQTLDVRSGEARAPAVVLHTSHGKFLEVSSDWGETKDRVDYHVMVVTHTSSPNSIRSTTEDGIQVLDSCSSVEFANHSQIVEIQIYSETDAVTSDVIGESCVTYDSVIVFQQRSGDGFAVSTTPSILGGVTFTDSARTLEQLLEGKNMRWSMQAARAY